MLRLMHLCHDTFIPAELVINRGIAVISLMTTVTCSVKQQLHGGREILSKNVINLISFEVCLDINIGASRETLRIAHLFNLLDVFKSRLLQ